MRAYITEYDRWLLSRYVRLSESVHCV